LRPQILTATLPESETCDVKYYCTQYLQLQWLAKEKGQSSSQFDIDEEGGANGIPESAGYAILYGCGCSMPHPSLLPC
jgi:hypothetical protein